MSPAITIIGNSIFHNKLQVMVVGGFITAIKSFGIHVQCTRKLFCMPQLLNQNP